jgi:hypothetical protein
MTKPAKVVGTQNAVRLAVMAPGEKAAGVGAMDAVVSAVKALAKGTADQSFAPRAKQKDAKPMAAPLALTVQSVVSALPARVAVMAEPSNAPMARQKAAPKHSRNCTPIAPRFVKSVHPARADVNVAAKVDANVLSVARVNRQRPSR